MLPDRVSNPRPLTYESGALPIALRGSVGYRGTCEIRHGLFACTIDNPFILAIDVSQTNQSEPASNVLLHFSLALKEPSKIAADHTYVFIFHFYHSKKIRLDV